MRASPVVLASAYSFVNQSAAPVTIPPSLLRGRWTCTITEPVGAERVRTLATGLLDGASGLGHRLQFLQLALRLGEDPGVAQIGADLSGDRLQQVYAAHLKELRLGIPDQHDAPQVAGRLQRQADQRLKRDLPAQRQHGVAGRQPQVGEGLGKATRERLIDDATLEIQLSRHQPLQHRVGKALAGQDDALLALEEQDDTRSQFGGFEGQPQGDLGYLVGDQRLVGPGSHGQQDSHALGCNVQPYGRFRKWWSHPTSPGTLHAALFWRRVRVRPVSGWLGAWPLGRQTGLLGYLDDLLWHS